MAAQQAWRAQWIAPPGVSATEPGVYHFRKDIEVVSPPRTLMVRISADNRYRLYVNGTEVSNGPARGDLFNWRYETIDIARHLRPGRNTLAALVWNFGPHKPAAQVSRRTAFLLDGEGELGSLVNTGTGWKVLTNKAYTFSPVVWPHSGGYYVAGPNETVDAREHPWGWDDPATDTSSWPAAVPVGGVQSRGSNPHGLAIDWQMVPRTIPLPEQRLIRFAEVRRATGVPASAGFLTGKSNLVIPANAKVTLLVDAGQLTMGYPVLTTSGGAGATASLTYAEALFDAQDRKGNRNEVEGKTIRGLRDTFRFDGGRDRRFQSLWLRAFRYVQIDVQTGAEPLQIRDLHAIFAAYPFEQRASFASDAPGIEPIWQLNWHALRLSAFETFWDTPYYEQLQYVGDTRIEALLSVYQSGDDRLMRNAIEQFANSRIADGLTLSSYPSSTPQLIPPFSLWWIGMVHDYWMLRDDPAFVRAMLPASRGVLDWFEGHIDDDSLLGAMPWWNFLDWTYEGGVPPGGRTGGSVPLTLQFVLSLREAAALEEALGRAELAPRYRALADRLSRAAQAAGWDDSRNLLADTPEKKVFSQQTNALAILADAVPAAQRRAVADRMLADRSLVQASLYFRFYVDEALRRAGMADRYLERLEPWREMLRNGLTATPETPDPSRSDSHAWSAHPNYHLLATVAGIRPAESGFRSVEIAPALGAFGRIRATMPHPRGMIRVELRKFGSRGVQGVVKLPAGVTGRLRWQEQTLELRNNTTVVHCDVQCSTR